MAIPESQLETWANQGAITTAKATADSVKNALNSYDDWPNGIDFEVYLQGSYKNDTNIRGDSDVDVVAQLNSTFYSNLSEDQKGILGITPATYHLSNFRSDVLKILKDYYGQSQITEGNKSMNLIGEWSGNLKSSFDNHSSEVKATLNIFQDWTRIKILMTTEQSSSHSESVSIVLTSSVSIFPPQSSVILV